MCETSPCPLVTTSARHAAGHRPQRSRTYRPLPRQRAVRRRETRRRFRQHRRHAGHRCAHGATVVDQDWLGFGPQRNFATTQASHDWILLLDADEDLTPSSVQELQRELPQLMESDAAGAILRREAWYMGAPMRWYRPMVGERLGRLYHRGRARWTDVRVHESLRFDGRHDHVRAALSSSPQSDAGPQAAQNAAVRGTQGTRLAGPRRPAQMWLRRSCHRRPSSRTNAAPRISRRLARLHRRADRGVIRGLQAHALLRNAPQSPHRCELARSTRPCCVALQRTAIHDLHAKHYLLYGSERYALAILRPLQDGDSRARRCGRLVFRWPGRRRTASR